MKVAGFTFIRNAVKYDYPVEEAIRSILPLCDEVVVCVGDSEDDTLGLVSAIDEKVRIIHSVWDKELMAGGKVLAVETDKAYQAIAEDTDWCIYIQGDEVIHEKYYPAIMAAMKKYKDDKQVEGLLFRYKHFYGSFDYVGDTRRWYSHEIRIVRKRDEIHSYRDAQGFRFGERKMNVKEIDAAIYHYGWVKHPDQQLQKILGFEKLYNDERLAKSAAKQFDYSGIDSLKKFSGTHPKVMQARIARINWTFDHDLSRKNFTVKGRILHWVEKLTGRRLFDYRNYRKI